MSDRRTLLARADLAAMSLEGVLSAEAYAPTLPMRAARARVAILNGPEATAERLDELLFGECFEVLERRGDWAWGQACRDGYVGWARLDSLSMLLQSPDHRVAALAAPVFSQPSIKSPLVTTLGLNALVAVVAVEGRLSRLEGLGWTPTAHLAPIGLGFRPWADAAEMFLGAPYLWGGRSWAGLDCSGLVQQALYAAGRACPRDSDQQARLGEAIGLGDLQRGDLVFWRGHVGMMLDASRLIHANAHHMMAAVEPLKAAMARIASGDGGEPTAFRRL